MLDYGYQRALEVMRFVSKVLIATDGPAGLLVGEFQCQSHGMQIFLFLPNTSDHLFNLENNPAVTLFCSGWEISGRGHIISDSSIPHDLILSKDIAAQHCLLVKVSPDILQIRRSTGWGYSETIDLQSFHE